MEMRNVLSKKSKNADILQTWSAFNKLIQEAVEHYAQFSWLLVFLLFEN